jgi:hypothetical protein
LLSISVKAALGRTPAVPAGVLCGPPAAAFSVPQAVSATAASAVIASIGRRRREERVAVLLGAGVRLVRQVSEQAPDPT